MEIAIRIHRNRHLILVHEERRFGLIRGRECATMTTLIRLDKDPVDQMRLGHGMRYAANRDEDANTTIIRFDRHDGKMLFTARFDGIRHKFNHIIATTHRIDTGILNHADQISAMFTNIKFRHSVSLLKIFSTYFIKQSLSLLAETLADHVI